MAGRVKAQKRSLSQPPSQEPPAKAAKPAKRISKLDLALTFETMLDSNHVLDLATMCYNEIIDVGEIVQEGVIRMAELFIYLCAFIQFYLNDPEENVFLVNEPRGSKSKGKGKKPASDDDESDDDDAKPARIENSN